MNWIKFSKIDCRFIMTQKMFIILFPILAVCIGFNAGMAFVLCYMCFGVLVVVTTPFYIENKNNSSFIQMLPGTEGDRVLGRYMAFVFEVIAATAFGLLASYVMKLLGAFSISSADFVIAGAGMVGTIIIGALELFLFYAVGRDKNEQLLNILRLVPGFIFFFGTMSFSEALEKDPELIKSFIRFVDDNQMLLIAGGIVLSIAILVLCITLSIRILKKRDRA